MGWCFPRITNRHSDVKITTHLVGWINQQRENMTFITSLYLLTLGANISPYRITKRYTILCLHLFTHKPHLSGNTLNNLQIFDDSQNWLMIMGGFVRRYFLLPLFSTKWKILPFPLYQTDTVNPYNGMRFQHTLMTMIVYFYACLKFSSKHFCPP